MGQHKLQRAQEALKEEISSIIREEIKDPRIGFASVVRVEASQDLRFARVFVSVLGDDDAKCATLEGLESAKGFIRSELGKRISLRFVPEISFKIDASIEHGDKIARLLREVSVGRESQDQ